MSEEVHKMLKNLIRGNLPLLKTVFLAGAIIGGLLGGATSLLIGITLGVMFAPKAGKDLRKDICDGFMRTFGLDKKADKHPDQYC
jgi:gas vesicle protein